MLELQIEDWKLEARAVVQLCRKKCDKYVSLFADKPTRRQQTRRLTNSPTIKLAKKPTANKTERGMAVHIRQVVRAVGGGSFSR